MDIEKLIPITFFIVVAYVFKLYYEYKIRKLAIDKGVVKEVQNILSLSSVSVRDNVPAALKWGMVLTAVGAAALFGLNMPNSTEEYTFSFMVLFAGLALVLYYFIAARMAKKNA